MGNYKTLSKKVLDLTSLNEKERTILREVYAGFETKSYSELTGFIFSQENLERMGAEKIGNYYYINKEVGTSIIYLVILDLLDRVGIKEGCLGKGENSDTDFSENKKTLERFLSE
jgi:hypothetical protein